MLGAAGGFGELELAEGSNGFALQCCLAAPLFLSWLRKGGGGKGGETGIPGVW